MSVLLSAQNLTFQFATEVLFKNLSLNVTSGSKIGVIGQNGCGKSTLLKVLNKDFKDYEGSVTYSSKCHIVRAEQHLPDALKNITLLDALLEKMTDEKRVTESWLAENLLIEMGFAERQINLTAGTLSGGEHTRLLLARAIIQEPTLLLLDEPSNHMDLPALLWIENFLKNLKITFVLISHDKQLMDNVTTSSWILRDKQVYEFNDTYTKAMEALIEQDEANIKKRADQQKEIDRVAATAKRFAAFGSEKVVKKAKNMERRVERMKESQTDSNAENNVWSISLQGENLPAKKIMSLDNVDVRPAPDAKILYNVETQTISSGDRVAILAVNGGGKSTLLKTIWSAFQDTGNAGVKFHPKCRTGYYDQSLNQLEDDDTLLQSLSAFGDNTLESKKHTLINAGFPYDRHADYVRGLSGGERARLLFAGLTLSKYHLLLLDEPTNHIDIAGKEQLAETLKAFQGAFVLVSHDRDLIEKSCNRFWSIKDNEFSEWHDLDQLYNNLLDSPMTKAVAKNANGIKTASGIVDSIDDEDESMLLETLCKLEEKLEQDQNRKPKHQKPVLQKGWIEEIEKIKKTLEA